MLDDREAFVKRVTAGEPRLDDHPARPVDPAPALAHLDHRHSLGERHDLVEQGRHGQAAREVLEAGPALLSEADEPLAQEVEMVEAIELR